MPPDYYAPNPLWTVPAQSSSRHNFIDLSEVNYDEYDYDDFDYDDDDDDDDVFETEPNFNPNAVSL